MRLENKRHLYNNKDGRKNKIHKMYLKLHDKLVKPVVKYNSEILTWEDANNRKNGKT
jgi:hypothetical protein